MYRMLKKSNLLVKITFCTLMFFSLVFIGYSVIAQKIDKTGLRSVEHLLSKMVEPKTFRRMINNEFDEREDVFVTVGIKGVMEVLLGRSCNKGETIPENEIRREFRNKIYEKLDPENFEKDEDILKAMDLFFIATAVHTFVVSKLEYKYKDVLAHGVLRVFDDKGEMFSLSLNSEDKGELTEEGYLIEESRFNFIRKYDEYLFEDAYRLNKMFEKYWKERLFKGAGYLPTPPY